VIVANLPSSCALPQLETKKTKNKLLGFFLANAKKEDKQKKFER